MQAALINPELASDEEVERQFTAGANLQPAECLAVYQRSYLSRLTRCLAEQFPALCHALGEPLFEQFAKRYLQIHPSDSYTLYELGRRFPDFLEADRPDKDLPPEQRETWIDFMVDLARYERTHFLLFDAPGNEGNKWPNADTADSQLVLQCCLQLRSYRYPVAWYYHNIKEDPSTRFPERQDSFIAVLRKDYIVTTYPIQAVQFRFLNSLLASKSVGQSLEETARSTGRSRIEVTRSWQNEVRKPWIDAGFFAFRDQCSTL